MQQIVSQAVMAVTVLFSTVVAYAQMDHGGHGTAAYPEVCKSSEMTPPTEHPEADMAKMKEHQTAAMAGMQLMNRDMMQGMMKDDADVAFVCGMIAHHQGAIDMAQVELEYGDNDWAKQMAQRVIDAQTKEIEEMTSWLKDNAK